MECEIYIRFHGVYFDNVLFLYIACIYIKNSQWMRQCTWITRYCNRMLPDIFPYLVFHYVVWVCCLMPPVGVQLDWDPILKSFNKLCMEEFAFKKLLSSVIQVFPSILSLFSHLPYVLLHCGVRRVCAVKFCPVWSWMLFYLLHSL